MSNVILTAPAYDLLTRAVQTLPYRPNPIGTQAQLDALRSLASMSPDRARLSAAFDEDYLGAYTLLEHTRERVRRAGQELVLVGQQLPRHWREGLF